MAEQTDLSAFADLHAVNRNEAEWREKSGFIAGKREPGTHNPLMIEAKGQRDFWVQFHEMPVFRSRDNCPHPVSQAATVSTTNQASRLSQLA